MKCVICGEEKNFKIHNNFDQHSKEIFQVQECKKCGNGVTVVAKNFDVGPYYPKEYYGEKNIRFPKIIEKLITYFRGKRAKLIEHYNADRPGRILDIGCGRGLMLKDLKDRGWEVTGVEFSEVSSEYAREVLGLDVRIGADLKKCAFPDNHFDVISLWHVYEHVVDPSETLEEIKRILSPGGRLILEVPLFSSWQAKIERAKWLYLEAPRHLHHYSKKSLETLLRSFSFQSGDSSTVSLEFGFFGMVQSLLNIVCPVPNFLFNLLKHRTPQRMEISTGQYFLNLFILAITIVPFGILGVLLETFAILFGQGGCYRIVSLNQKR